MTEGLHVPRYIRIQDLIQPLLHGSFRCSTVLEFLVIFLEKNLSFFCMVETSETPGVFFSMLFLDKPCLEKKGVFFFRIYKKEVANYEATNHKSQVKVW